MAIPVNSSFDAGFYLASNEDVRKEIDALVKDKKVTDVASAAYQHWLNFGATEGRNPNAFFNTQKYLADNLDVKKAFLKDGLNPLTHYDTFGWVEERGTGAKGLFDVKFYVNNNPKAAATNPVAHLLASLRAAAASTASTAGALPTSLLPNALYSMFDYNYYLTKNADVAKEILGADKTVPANDAITQAAKAKVLLHWFIFGQHESRAAHTTGSTSNDKTSDFTRLDENNVVGAIHYVKDTVSNVDSYTATSLNDSFIWTSDALAKKSITVAGWGGEDSTFVWDSSIRPQDDSIKISGIKNVVFTKNLTGFIPTDLTGTILKGANMDSFGVMVTELAVIHSGTYQFWNGVTTSEVKAGGTSGDAGSGSSAFYNLNSITTDIYIQGMGVTAAARFDLFGYKAAPTANTVNLTVKGITQTGNFINTVNLSSVGADDIKTVKIKALSNSALTLSAADGDDTGTVLKAQTVTKLVLAGDAGVTLTLTDGVGTSGYLTLDASAFKGNIVFTASKSDHAATIIGGDKGSELLFNSNHTKSVAASGTGTTAVAEVKEDTRGQTFQFSTSETITAGSYVAANSVGKIFVKGTSDTGSTTSLSMIDHFNFSTKIFGITTEQLAKGALTASVATNAITVTNTNNADSYLFIGNFGAATGGYTLGGTGTDLNGDAAANEAVHSAIVVLQDATTANKVNIYFTTDVNTFGKTDNTVLIGSYAQSTSATGTFKAFTDANFHIVA